jgi:GT2 family glycosyltransferase
MPFPEASIILVNWNGLEDTIECLESLKKITYPNYEVIVVDNASRGDDVRILVERFGNYVHVIQNDKNYGFAKGCNIGIKDALARGTDYVLLLNNDTVVAPDFLEELVKVAQNNVEVGIVGGKIYTYESPEQIWFAGGSINYWTGNTPIRGKGQIDCRQFEDICEVDWIVGCFMLISRDLLLTAGTLDDRLFFGWEDVDLCIRAQRSGFKVLFAPGSKIWHKALTPGKSERLAGLPAYHASKNHFIVLEKHGTKLQLASSISYFIITLPKVMWTYSSLLGQWKTSVYILWGFLDYLRRKW